MECFSHSQQPLFWRHAMFEVIRESCESLVTQFDDFWLIAAITDSSYEEGTRNSDYARAIYSFERAGVLPTALRQLRAGINGNLATVLESKSIGATRNVECGPDLELRRKSSSGEIALLEVKLIFDCTALKYYPAVAQDRVKL